MKKFLATIGLMIAVLFVLQGLRAGFASVLQLLTQSQDHREALIRLAVAIFFAVFGYSGCKSCWAILSSPSGNVKVTIEKP